MNDTRSPAPSSGRDRDSGLATGLASGLARVLGAPLGRCDAFRPADAVVVLGSLVYPGGRLSRLLDERVVAGVELWRQGGAPILCMSGGSPNGCVEADAMARRARELGVPDAALRLERESRNTGENARFSARMLLAEGCRTVWIVSQPFHLFRARFLFRKYGLTPLTWHAEDSLQFRRPRQALRLITREYAALARMTVFEAAERMRGGGPRE